MWQPIETAPKDGRWLLCAERQDDVGQSWPYVSVARWDADYPCVEDSDEWAYGEWVASPNEAVIDPTHWMPLPEPPRE